MKPIAPQRDESVPAIMGPASNPGPRNPASVAVAVAGVLQPLSNFKFGTVNSFVSKLFEFEPYSAEY